MEKRGIRYFPEMIHVAYLPDSFTPNRFALRRDSCSQAAKMSTALQFFSVPTPYPVKSLFPFSSSLATVSAHD